MAGHVFLRLGHLNTGPSKEILPSRPWHHIIVFMPGGQKYLFVKLLYEKLHKIYYKSLALFQAHFVGTQIYELIFVQVAHFILALSILL